ncbi:hypothetical protein RF11_03385 [Thelohanellus kitauei]|uniref:Uncharacterized protein n=1 Tax=Thelohanellus kitauei TaxID=669202 RepID=A0A0C2IXZ1_THEKT|nr:hypothetical protein RF11_03385 [Thelohanellus kitauei]
MVEHVMKIYFELLSLFKQISKSNGKSLNALLWMMRYRWFEEYGCLWFIRYTTVSGDTTKGFDRNLSSRALKFDDVMKLYYKLIHFIQSTRLIHGCSNHYLIIFDAEFCDIL